MTEQAGFHARGARWVWRRSQINRSQINLSPFCSFLLKSGDAALISGYLGKTDSFDQAIGKFSIAYANQNAADHGTLLAAEKSGRIIALREEE